MDRESHISSESMLLLAELFICGILAGWTTKTIELQPDPSRYA